MNMTKALLNQQEAATLGRLLYMMHPRFGLLWGMGIETGFRIGDLLRLRLKDVKDFKFIMREQKTGNRRPLELSEGIRQEIDLYASRYRILPSDYLFYSGEQNKRKPMSRQWAHRVISRMARLRGLKSIGVHSMRKMYACNLFRATGSILSVQGALGHKHPSTTMIYLKDLLEGQI